MRYILFYLFIAVLSVQTGVAQTTRLTNFEELMSSLNAGEQVRVVIYYKQCERGPGEEEESPVPDAITGMNIDTYEHFAPGAAHNESAFVVFSTSKLIQNPMGKGFVYNYGKVRVNADNSVIVTAKYVHPKSLKTLMDESFIGKLNDGQNTEGINLFITNK